MAKKDLIIGGVMNYGINQLKPWVISINEVCGDNVDKVIVYSNVSDETCDWLREQGFKLIPMAEVPLPVHVLRFLSIYKYLNENWKKYRYVVTTDVKDVYFQENPFVYVESVIHDGYELIACSEGLKYKDEPWGDDNLLRTYGHFVHDCFRENEIYNVGTLGGTSEYIKDLVFNIFTNAVNRPISIVDQAVFNVLINTQPYKDVTFFCDDWACEAGTLVDPIKLKYFLPKLTRPIPTFENGVVKHNNGKTYPIVHQYDRVPDWKKFVQQKYGQEDESEYFIYRV